MVPNAAEIAFIVNPRSAAGAYQVKELTAAAKASGQRIVVLNVGAEPDVNPAFETIAKHKVGAVLYSANLFYQVVLDQLVALAARHAVPAMYEWREFVKAGGLMSYSVSRHGGLAPGRSLYWARATGVSVPPTFRSCNRPSSN